MAWAWRACRVPRAKAVTARAARRSRRPTGKYDEAVLKRMMAYRVPVFCQEFDVFVDMLRINELLPQDEE